MSATCWADPSKLTAARPVFSVPAEQGSERPEGADLLCVSEFFCLVVRADRAADRSGHSGVVQAERLTARDPDAARESGPPVDAGIRTAALWGAKRTAALWGAQRLRRRDVDSAERVDRNFIHITRDGLRDQPIAYIARDLRGIA